VGLKAGRQEEAAGEDAETPHGDLELRGEADVPFERSAKGIAGDRPHHDDPQPLN
jgi:hypothetical protein